jgi:hypothetical protein
VLLRLGSWRRWAAEAIPREAGMVRYAALDVSLETTAICVVDEDGHVTAEAKVRTCPDAIRDFLAAKAPNLRRVGLETGPLAVWLWNELEDRQLPVVCLDARHANAALKVRPVKTDRNDAARGPGPRPAAHLRHPVRCTSQDLI